MKKFISILIISALVCMSLAACGKSSDSSAKGGPQIVTESSSTTAAATETDEKTSAEETSSEKPVETALPVKTASAKTNLLTGIDNLPEDAAGKRPVAVMVNNIEESLPQYGIDAADIIFEVPVEHGLTRLLAIYPDYIHIPDICSVRSYRAYFPPLGLGMDAFYIHWGEDMTMMDYYRSLSMDSYDGLNGGMLFGRDNARMNSGYGLEHTSVFYGTLLADAIARDGKRTDLGENYAGKTAFNFYDSDTPYAPEGSDIKEADINYGDMTAALKYDSEKKVYLKDINGHAQVDGKSGSQLSFTNVFILITPIKERDDDLHKDIDWSGKTSNVGYFLTQGKQIPIKWEKNNEYSQFRFYDENGKDLVINQGRTYLTFCEEYMVDFK